jgi:hypothetical protein
MHATQVLYHLSYDPSPFVFIVFEIRSHYLLAQAGLNLTILLLLPPE